MYRDKVLSVTSSLRCYFVSFSEKLVYIGASLGVVVLALAIVLLIFFRHRNRDIDTSSGTKNRLIYSLIVFSEYDGSLKHPWWKTDLPEQLSKTTLQ